MPRHFTILSVLLLAAISANADAAAAQRWHDRFRHADPAVSAEGVCEGTVGNLPDLTAYPPAAGVQLVRVSVPFEKGAVPAGLAILAEHNGTTMQADVRPLTYHPGVPRSVRRAMITFPFAFENMGPHEFNLRLHAAEPAPNRASVSDSSLHLAGTRIEIQPDGVAVTRADGTAWRASVVAPERTSAYLPQIEAIELGTHYAWVRLLVPDDTWPRIIDVQVGANGGVSLELQLQRLEPGDATAPDLGWELGGLAFQDAVAHAFDTGMPAPVTTSDGSWRVEFPYAAQTRRGGIVVEPGAESARLRYLRCRADERVPFQSAAWRTAAIAVMPSESAPLTPLRTYRMRVEFAESSRTVVAGSAPMSLATWPVLDDLRDYTRAALVQSACVGDDFGNVTSFTSGSAYGGVHGMNRLNHCPSMFHDAWRAGDWALRDTAVQWCVNMHDLSVWWGDTAHFGGTRYNNATAAGVKEHEGDTNFMWRTNDASTFCSKGFSSFLLAYEETGDPRMATALRHQVAYATQFIRANEGECRNAGAAGDFMELYAATGVSGYRDAALRLYRELRTKLSSGGLFSQGGQPIEAEPVFIDDDAMGTKHPFAKPYIIGYGLFGAPELLEHYPDEDKLADMIRAVSTFLASTGDPAGGWRYPHPDSSGCILGQGMEHAVQLVRAAQALESRGEPVAHLLDAIEGVLQSRVLGFARTGTILSYLQGWERSTGALTEGESLHDRYKLPSDRDKTRDYTEGTVSLGSAPPDALVYFDEVLSFYLARRPAERLFHGNEKLEQVLARTPDNRMRLTPAEDGTTVLVDRPDDTAAGFVIRMPDWSRFPVLVHSDAPVTPITWKRDERTHALHGMVEIEPATISVTLTPYINYIDCSYTLWPNPVDALPKNVTVITCLAWKGHPIDLNGTKWSEAASINTNGAWIPLSADMRDDTRSLVPAHGEAPGPAARVVASVSPDGNWTLACAAELCASIHFDGDDERRCVHVEARTPIFRDGPVTIRTSMYLVRGSLDHSMSQAARTWRRWRESPGAPAAGMELGAKYGLRAQRPAFTDARVREMDFPLAWQESGMPFDAWRLTARERFLDALMPRPDRVPYSETVIAVEDRGTYEARKLLLNLSSHSRVYAYLLAPKGSGPHPAIVTLHDHGAHFSIGKEKVVRPFAEPQSRLADAQSWVNKYYSGRWIGDALAERGYVVFATDALFWGDRGRYEGVSYEEQQALAANMFQLGLSWAGTIVWDDVRSAEFVQGLSFVDPDRIGCVGLSMGANRAWHLAAATDVIRAGAAVCWLGDTATLMAEGNNQTKGQSAFSMIHPGLRTSLDYPDVAALACPKPMLFYNGDADPLFPLAGVESCFARMREVWAAAGMPENLETRIWASPHEFNADMQAAAFLWLDQRLGMKAGDAR